LGRLFAKARLHGPLRLVGCNDTREWLDQLGGTASGWGVVRGPHAAEHSVPREHYLPTLCCNDGAGIGGVFLDRIELDAANGILYVELVLERERNCLRVADDQEIVWYFVGIGGARSRALTSEECLFRISGTVSIGSGVFPIVAFLPRRC